MFVTTWETRSRPLTIKDVALAVDDSGSTSGNVMRMQLEYVVQPLVDLKESVSYQSSITPLQDMILWSSDARFVSSHTKANFSMGGTQPISILQNPDCLKFVESRPVFMLCTDGCISSADVEQFTRRGQHVFGAATLVIGIIIGNYAAPGLVDISVTSALMTLGRNCLIIGMDVHGKTLRILFAEGMELKQQLSEMEMLPPSDFDGSTPWTSFPALGKDWVAFLKRLNFVDAGVPPNHVILECDGKTTKTVDMDLLLDYKEERLPIETLLSWDWTEIVLYAKRQEQQDAIRKLVNRIESESISRDVPEHVQTRRQRLNELISLGLSDVKLKSEYGQLMQQELKWSTEQQDRHRPIRQFCQRILADLHTHEVSHASWQLKDHLRSNRAKRADLVAPPEPDDLLKSNLKYLETECQICYNEGPTALLLNPSDDDSFYTSDFAIDCPLACGYHAAKKFCNFHVCFDCARFFWAQRRDMYQRPVQGIVPIILSNQKFSDPERNAFLQMMRQSFAMGLNLNHGPLLMLAAIESLGSHAWSEGLMWAQIKKNMLDFLVHNVVTTEYLTAEPQALKVSVYKAILSVSQSVPHFMAKPLSMQLLIMRLLKFYYVLPQDLYVKLMRMTLLTLVASFFKVMDGNSLEEFIKFFQTQSFDHVYGVMQRGTIHAVDFWNMDLWESLCKAWQHKNNKDISFIIGTLRGYEKLTGFDFEHMKTYWTYLLHSLSYIMQHSLHPVNLTLMDLTNYFIGKDPVLVGIGSIDFQKFDAQWCKTNVFRMKGHCVDSPPYYLNLGPYSCPDATRCHCGYALLPSGHYDSLKQAAEVIRFHRQEHFPQVYGAVHPNSKSHHVLMHSTVADVMCHPLECKNPLESVFHRFNKSAGTRGDVFKPDLKASVEQCIKDFMVIQKEHDYTIDGDVLMTRSLEYKLACILHKKRLIQCDPLIFLQSQSGFDFP